MTSLDFSLPRGIRDIEPEEYELHSRIRVSFEEVARAYNFKLMEPASIEHISILRAKSGEDVDKEIYAFEDKGGREIGLRFDLTVGMTRYVCSRRDLKLPVKLAAFGGMWRYDEPQYGRYRWAHQWDLEIFGPPSVDADAEVVDASAAILRRAGVGPAKVRIGDRRVVEEFVREGPGSSDARAAELMRALDKTGKKTRAELQKEYGAKGFSDAEFSRVMDFGEVKGPPDKVLQKLQELGLASTKDLAELRDSLRSRKVENFEFDLSIVRGIDYYTGIVFEAADEKLPRLGSLFGGGRYDALPKLFGRPELSATGAAGGVERESMSLGKSSARAQLTAVIATASPEVYPQAVGVLSELRSAGISSDLSGRGKSLAKQLEEAGASNALWAVIVGRKEVEKGVVTLRNLKERAEEQVSLKEAVLRMA